MRSGISLPCEASGVEKRADSVGLIRTRMPSGSPWQNSSWSMPGRRTRTTPRPFSGHAPLHSIPRPERPWLHQKNVAPRFRQLCAEAGIPLIRLHDLRHGAATLAHAAGGDLKADSGVARSLVDHNHGNTYTSVLPVVERRIADAASRLIPRTRRTGGVPWAPLVVDGKLPSAAALPAQAGRTGMQRSGSR